MVLPSLARSNKCSTTTPSFHETDSSGMCAVCGCQVGADSPDITPPRCWAIPHTPSNLRTRNSRRHMATRRCALNAACRPAGEHGTSSTRHLTLDLIRIERRVFVWQKRLCCCSWTHESRYHPPKSECITPLAFLYACHGREPTMSIGQNRIHYSQHSKYGQLFPGNTPSLLSKRQLSCTSTRPDETG